MTKPFQIDSIRRLQCMDIENAVIPTISCHVHHCAAQFSTALSRQLYRSEPMFTNRNTSGLATDSILYYSRNDRFCLQLKYVVHYPAVRVHSRTRTNYEMFLRSLATLARVFHSPATECRAYHKGRLIVP